MVVRAHVIKQGLADQKDLCFRHMFDMFVCVSVQLETLLRKNLALLWHRKLFTLTMLAFPPLFVLLLFWLSSAIGGQSLTPVDLQLTKCRLFNVFNAPAPGSCITLMYAPDTPEVSNVMRRFAEAEHLVFGTDVVGAASRSATAAYMFDNIGLVDTAVVFHDQANFTSGLVPYDMWVNATRASAYASAGDDELCVLFLVALLVW